MVVHHLTIRIVLRNNTGFAGRARAGQSIVVAGEGWGSGSSREQAVWALLGAGIQAVVARSYAFIHKRNLVNEALPYLEATRAWAPDNVELHYFLGLAYLQTGLDEGARLVTPDDVGELTAALSELPAQRGRRYADPHSWAATVAAYTDLAMKLAMKPAIELAA